MLRVIGQCWTRFLVLTLCLSCLSSSSFSEKTQDHCLPQTPAEGERVPGPEGDSWGGRGVQGSFETWVAGEGEMAEERRLSGGGGAQSLSSGPGGRPDPSWGQRVASVLLSVSLSGSLGPTSMGNDKRKAEGQSGPGGPSAHVVRWVPGSGLTWCTHAWQVRPPCAHVPPQGRGQGRPRSGPPGCSSSLAPPCAEPDAG